MPQGNTDQEALIVKHAINTHSTHKTVKYPHMNIKPHNERKKCACLFS